MRSIAIVAALTLGACKSSSPTASSGGVAAEPRAETGSSAETDRDASQVSTEIRAAMTELASYSERLYAIMREMKDCDAAAQQLEALVPRFQELGPRMMKVKERMMALSERDRERVKRESDDLMEAMKKKFADADAIEQKGKDCEKSSPRFAAVIPKVAFVKKH